MGERDPRPCLGRHLEREWGVRLFPIHRLDFEVSGLVLYAFDAESHRAANHWFEARWITKVYEAFTETQTEDQLDVTVEWRSQILRGKRRAYESELGQWAITRARCLGKIDNSAWLRWNLEPLTGRPHQLRYELSKQGFPIVGDKLYGAQTDWKHEGIALRAIKLGFGPVKERLGLPENLSVPPLLEAVL